MRFKNFLDDINIDSDDKLYLATLLIFSIIFTVIVVNQKLSFNIRSDTLVYLIDSSIYAGLNGNITNFSTMYLSPPICFLSSLLMRIGLVKESIFIVTGCFSILNNLIIYILLKYRYNRLFSLFGSVLLNCFSLVIIYWGDGTLDLPVLALSVAAMLFAILAVDINPKYYLICFPLTVFAIFTKYTAFFLIPLIFLYYLSKHDFFNAVDKFFYDRESFKIDALNYLKSEEFKYIYIGILISIGLFILFSLVILSFTGKLYFLTQINDSNSGYSSKIYVQDSWYNEDYSYYIANIVTIFSLTFFIGKLNFAYVLLILLVISISIHLITSVINSDSIKYLMAHKTQFKTRHFKSGLYLLILIMALTCIYGCFNSHLLANISLLVMIVIIFSLLDKIPINNNFYSINFLMIAWFLIYFIFFSYINIKSSRYILPGFVPVIYFIVWSLESIFKTIQNNFDVGDEFLNNAINGSYFNFSNTNRGKILKIILIALICILMIYSLTQNIEYEITSYDNNDLNEVFNYLKLHDDDYSTKNITSKSSYIARYGTWFLKSDIKCNKSLNKSATDDYIISVKPIKYPHYKLSYHKDKYRIYERKNTI